MTTEAFSNSLAFVLRWEGGYVDDPADPGGKTNRGVTQRVYDAWRGRKGLPVRSVRDIEDAEVAAIYETGYWLPPRCNVLESKLDLVQFDTAVNMGVNRAIRMLQGCLGCTVDGNFGPNTQHSAASCDLPATIAAYCQAREDYYRRLVSTRPTLSKFLGGWLNRLNSLRREASLSVPGTTRGIAPPETGITARIPDIGVDPDYDL